MRFVNLLVAGLLVVGTLACHSTWALAGDELGREHSKQPHSHATPEHANDGGEAAFDPCDLKSVLKAPSFGGTGPVAVIGNLPVPDAFAPFFARPPFPPTEIRVLPTTPVHQHVVLLI